MTRGDVLMTTTSTFVCGLGVLGGLDNKIFVGGLRFVVFRFLFSVGTLLVCANVVGDEVAMVTVIVDVVSCSSTGFYDHWQGQKIKEKVKSQLQGAKPTAKGLRQLLIWKYELID